MTEQPFSHQFVGAQFRRAHVMREERELPVESTMEICLQDQYAWFSKKTIRRSAIDKFAKQLNALSLDIASVTDDVLKSQFQLAAAQISIGLPSEDDLGRMLACAGEASKRVLGKYPYGVQFFGALQLIHGRLIEMQTGEGKSLVAALAASVMATAGASVHIISVNDYLSERDCKEMRPLFEFLGLTCSYVCEGMESDQRFDAYRCSICYASGKELVFDDLKDRMAGRGRMLKSVSQLRDFIFNCSESSAEMKSALPNRSELPLIPAMHFAIIDEADSVLIDEAKTPMILSRTVDASGDEELWNWAIAQSCRLVRNLHFRISDGRVIELLDRAMELIKPFDGKTSAIWQSLDSRNYLITQALSALHLFVKDQHYIVADGKVLIVDESTGRVMPDRAWEQGLHQLIEAKERVAITDGRETFARMTFQRFFRHYYLVSGLSGTVSETSKELWCVYRLRVVCLPPHRVNRRRLSKSLCCTSTEDKWKMVGAEVLQRSYKGQPVLVGTRSVQASEQLSAVLNQMGLDHVVLNARQTQDEAEIVAMAGRTGKITVATNMAGRGTDIKLDEKAIQNGGLHVILTEYHESARVDRQLFGRAGRQGDPGSGIAIVSSEDYLFERFARKLTRMWVGIASPTVRHLMMEWVRRLAQWRAESISKESRLQTLRQDRNLQSLIGVAGKRL